MSVHYDTTSEACLFEAHQYDTLVDHSGRRLCVRCGHPEQAGPDDRDQADGDDDDDTPFHTTYHPPTHSERVESALVTILSSWDRWSAEAAQQAQQDQHPDSYTDTMEGFLRPVLEGLR